MIAPRWRVWTYERPAIVLGCSQRALRERAERQLGGRCAVLERESGGGAVLVGPWLVSVSLVLPSGHEWLGSGLLQSYRRLGQLHAEALAELGVASTALSPQEVRGWRASGSSVPDWACFGNLSPWEVVDAQGRKLVGLAQRKRQHGALLVAGTLVAMPDWDLLCDALGDLQDAALLRQRTTNCELARGRSLLPGDCAEVLQRRLSQALTERAA